MRRSLYLTDLRQFLGKQDLGQISFKFEILIQSEFYNKPK